MRTSVFAARCISFILPILLSCNDKTSSARFADINSLDLKRGKIVSCGPGDGELFGSVSFTASVPGNLKKDFNIAIALLHSFEYDESEKMFANIIERSPDCAMAYWGVAMSNFHPLWNPPTQAELKKGEKAIEIARSINGKTKRESDYIDALSKFFENADQIDHRSRVISFERAMEKLYQAYPEDIEAAIFYTLALDAAADPRDKTYANQKKAFSILSPIFLKEPLHPGVAHYIIHNCDYPALAELALPAARKYASIAPASAHAQHMPSHIFTRLGLWDESIHSDSVSVSAAQCYASKAKIKGHWDEELHGMDYLVYAYLQKGDDQHATQFLDYLQTIHEVYPVNFKTAYAFAAMPARYTLERKMWKEAATLSLHPKDFPWEKFPWQEAIVHFARLLGSAHTGNIEAAKAELKKLNELHDTLATQKDVYKATQVMIQVKIGEAWILFAEKKFDEALQIMTAASDLEDKTEKSPVTPGEVLPAKELLADMLLQLNKPADALKAYEANLKTHPNRLNSLYNAVLAAAKSNNTERKDYYQKQLVAIAGSSGVDRSELKNSKLYY